MKSVSLLLAAVVIAFSFPACATHKSSTAQCCSSGGSCDAPDAKNTTHSHAKKKSQ
jgi:hypothetical protein